MIKHVVFFQMKDEAEGASAQENAKKLAEKFQEISKVIDGVISCETGFNHNSEKNFYHLCLIQQFKSQKALDDYLVHQRHLEVKDFVFRVIDHRMVVDFDVA